MSTQTTTPRDPELWEEANKRAGFKSHLLTYALMVPFFWIVWFLSNDHKDHDGIPWPIWPMVGWGFGLFFHFLGVYVFEKKDFAEREYQKLLREKK